MLTSPLLLLLQLVIALIPGKASIPTSSCAFPDLSKYEGTHMMDATIDFKVHHLVKDDTLFLALQANHTGWLGIGFAEEASGSMKGSDIVTVEVVDGETRVQDRHCNWVASNPEQGTLSDPQALLMDGLTADEDVHNDWTVHGGYEDEGQMVVEISRPLDTGDLQDRVITMGNTKIIWAWNDGDDVGYHGSRRGTATIPFIEDPSDRIPEHDGVWEFRIDNFSVPVENITTYACQSFELPVDKRRHIVALEPIINDESIGIAHHVLVYQCSEPSPWYQEHLPSQGGPKICKGRGSFGGASDPAVLDFLANSCSTGVYAAATNGTAVIFPPEAGMAVSDQEGDLRYIYAEFHYDNTPQKKNLVDTSGFRAYYTDTPREHDIGFLILGTYLDRPITALPPSSPFSTSGVLALSISL